MYYEYSSSRDKYENNYSHENNKRYLGSSFSTASDREEGQLIPDSQLNKSFFEFNLGWDFDTVWQWNDTENRPELRPQPRPDWAMPAAAEPLQVAEGQTSLLLQQLQANIWLRQG